MHPIFRGEPATSKRLLIFAWLAFSIRASPSVNLKVGLPPRCGRMICLSTITTTAQRNHLRGTSSQSRTLCNRRATSLCLRVLMRLPSEMPTSLNLPHRRANAVVRPTAMDDSNAAMDRGRERRSPSPPSEPAVQFSRDGLSSQLFPHRDWRAKRWASDIVNSPRSAKKAFGHCW